MENRNDYTTLVEAVERYVNTEEYPKVEVICAILGISINRNALENQK